MDVKKFRKNSAHKCMFCEERERTALDVHRIVPGCDGGEYKLENTICVCANCHRKIHHSDTIKIDKWYASSKGEVLHCWVDGVENYLSVGD